MKEKIFVIIYSENTSNSHKDHVAFVIITMGRIRTVKIKNRYLISFPFHPMLLNFTENIGMLQIKRYDKITESNGKNHKFSYK